MKQHGAPCELPQIQTTVAYLSRANDSTAESQWVTVGTEHDFLYQNSAEQDGSERDDIMQGNDFSIFS